MYYAQRACLCVLCGSQNTEPLLRSTELTDFCNPDGVGLQHGTNCER